MLSKEGGAKVKIQFSIRVDSTAKAKIEEIAKKNSRTLSGQIEFIINNAIADFEKVNGKIEIDIEE